MPNGIASSEQASVEDADAKKATDRAWIDFCHMLLASNWFLYIE